LSAWDRDRDLRIYGAQLGVTTHHNFVATENNHRGCRFGLKRNNGSDVIKLRAKIIEYLLCGLRRATRTMDYKVKFPFIDLVACFHKGMNVASLHGKVEITSTTAL